MVAIRSANNRHAKTLTSLAFRQRRLQATELSKAEASRKRREEKKEETQKNVHEGFYAPKDVRYAAEACLLELQVS